jgi:hypothetical protein
MPEFPPMQDRDGVFINYNDFVLLFAKIVGAGEGGEGEVEVEVEAPDGRKQKVKVAADQVRKSESGNT